MKVVSINAREDVLRDIPAQLRDLAERIEQGEPGAVSHVAVVVLCDGEIDSPYVFGMPMKKLEVVGLLDIAKTRVVDDMLGDE